MVRILDAVYKQTRDHEYLELSFQDEHGIIHEERFADADGDGAIDEYIHTQHAPDGGGSSHGTMILLWREAEREKGELFRIRRAQVIEFFARELPDQHGVDHHTHFVDAPIQGDAYRLRSRELCYRVDGTMHARAVRVTEAGARVLFQVAAPERLDRFERTLLDGLLLLRDEAAEQNADEDAEIMRMLASGDGET